MLQADVATLRGSHQDELKSLAKFRGLLHRFGNPIVRRDFMDGEIGVTHSCYEVLLCLDLFSGIQLPTPFVVSDQLSAVDRIGYF